MIVTARHVNTSAYSPTVINTAYYHALKHKWKTWMSVWNCVVNYKKSGRLHRRKKLRPYQMTTPKQDYEWVGMDKIPPTGSMIPLDRKAYIADMQLIGDALSRQVQVDTPRSHVYICDEEGLRVRIKDGIFLEEYVRQTVPQFASAVLALSTQTVLAAPLRALSTCLAPKDLYLAECADERVPMTVEIMPRGPSTVSVNVWKELGLMRPTSSMPIEYQRVRIHVEYDSNEPYVIVYLTSKHI